MQRRMWRRGPDGEIVRTDRVESGPATDTTVTATEALATARRASLGIGLRLGARDTYDYLGAVLLMSVAWCVVAALSALGGHALGRTLFHTLPGVLPALLSFILALGGAVLLTGPLVAGLFRFARNAAARSEPEVWDLAWGYRQALERSVGLAAAHAFGALLLGGNWYFYSSVGKPWSAVLGAVFGYGLAFWMLMSLYGWPLLAEQEIGTRAILKKSLLLVLDNLFYTLGLALVLLLLSALLWGLVVGAVLLWAGATAMLLTQATRELLRKYEVLPPDPTLDPIAGETHELRGLGRHE